MATDAKQMSKTERQTLIRLVKQRFKLLATGLEARRSALRRVIQQEIIEENKAEGEAWKQRFEDEVIEPIQALLQTGDKLIDEAREAGFDRQGYRWRSLVELLNRHNLDSTFLPDNLQAKVEERMIEKIGDRPMSRFALEMEESKLVEELLVGDLGSDDAKGFLDRVPTLENMIPLPNGGASKAAIMRADVEAEQAKQSGRRR